jgi:imidazolonepropionase-like amidohydrolase
VNVTWPVRAGALVVLLAVAAGPWPTAGTLEAQAPAPGAPVVIRGATLVTITKGTIPNGTIVLRDGKIAAIGSTVDVPRGAEVIDGTGKFVTPGIIDAHIHIAADSINEGATTVSSMTGIEDVLDPTDIDIYRDLAGGVTSANVLHGSANPIGGKNAVIKLRWGKTTTEEMLFAGAPPGIKFALGENPKDLRQGFRTGPLRSRAQRNTGRRGRTSRGARRRARPSSSRAAICSSNHSSKCSKASASCTRTRTGLTRS